ncbi:MAG: ABC transporter permease subunit [Oligoflexia bacterium]|nr:ABC transporter permease subunit [Oligoflexia bacterium]
MRKMHLHLTNILLKKELYSYFTSPLPYLLACIFIFLLGWNFFHSLVTSKEDQMVSLSNSVIIPIFGNINFLFLFIAPLLTMRSFAEEKRDQTIELLFTSSLTDLEIIVAKYLAVISVTLFILLFTTIFPIILALSGYNDWPIIFSNYLGTIINIACYLAVGILISSCTQNQILSALISFALLVFLLLLAHSSNIISNFSLGQMVAYLSLSNHLWAFSAGAINSSDLIYYFSFIIFIIFLTHRSLSRRKW